MNTTQRTIINIVAVVLVVGAGYGIFELIREQQTQARVQAAMQAPPITNVAAIDIGGFAFQTPNVEIPVGSTITWTNVDGAEHDVAFRNGMAKSASLTQGKAYSYNFSAPGTYDYFCSDHPQMVGKVIVTP